MPATIPRAAATVIACLIALAWQPVAAQQPELKCEIGPVSRSFGATPWLVYACADGKSLVVVSAPNSPAAPFYFMIYPKEGKYAVVGEGTGAKSARDRAYSELIRLSEKDIVALIAAAKK